MNCTCIENVLVMYYEQKRKALWKPSRGEKYRYIRLMYCKYCGYKTDTVWKNSIFLHMYCESRADTLQTKQKNSESVTEAWMIQSGCIPEMADALCMCGVWVAEVKTGRTLHFHFFCQSRVWLWPIFTVFFIIFPGALARVVQLECYVVGWK